MVKQALRAWRIWLIIIIGFSLVLIGCSTEYKLHRGLVVAKNYEPSEVYTTYVCVSFDSRGLCNVSVPVTQEDPERFYLVLTDCEVWHDGCFHEAHQVDAWTWGDTQVGDRWDDGSGKANSHA